MMANLENLTRAERALLVLVLTEKTASFLLEHDPQALRQALSALHEADHVLDGTEEATHLADLERAVALMVTPASR